MALLLQPTDLHVEHNWEDRSHRCIITEPYPSQLTREDTLERICEIARTLREQSEKMSLAGLPVLPLG